MNKKIKNVKIWDLLIVSLFIPLASILTLKLKVNFLCSTFLFFGLPAIYLSWKNKKKIKKILLFSVVFTVPFSIIIDYIATLDQAWYVPEFFFSFRLFNVVPIDDIIWGFFLVYTTIMFYEYFLDKGRDKFYYKQLKYFLWIVSLALLLFVIILNFQPSWLFINYSYAILGLVLILIPSLIFLLFFPKILFKFIKASFYFFFLALSYEMTGLTLSLWTFPGSHFIGWVEILNHRFPLEEFFFWIIFITIGILSYYEFFNDDRK